MTQLITEAKRMQQLAGIKVEFTNKQIVEEILLEAFIERHCLENKILQESLDEAIIGKIKDAISKLNTKGKQAINTISYGLKQIPSEEGKTLYFDAIKAIAKYKIPPEQVKMALSSSSVKKEAEDNEEDFENVAADMKKQGYSDEEIQKHLDSLKSAKKNPGFQIIQKWGDWIRNTKLGKIVTTALTLGTFGAAIVAPIAANLMASPVTIEKAAQDTTVDSLSPSKTGTASDVGAQIQGKSLPSVDSEPNTSVHFIQFDYGKGKTLNSVGEKDIDGIVNNIKDIKKSYPDSELDIDVTGLVSKTTGDVKKGTDTKDPLDQAREKTVQQKINDKIEQSGLKGVKVNVKSNSPDAYKSQKQVKPGETGGAGAVVVIKGKNLQDKAEVPPPYIDNFAYDYAESNVNLKNTKKTEKPSTEKDEPITVLPKPIKTAPVIPDTDVTTKVSNLSKLNRNGQIATVLATINPSLDISKALKADTITSYTDKFLTTTQGDAKKIATLILNIRKNPNALLNKVSKALDIKLEPRAKAVATKPSTTTQAQLQPVKENISMISLLEEAMIDQISDEDIKKNKKAILAFLGTMYASAGNTQLSIIPNDVADKEELASLGFTPQPGGNYVFLQPGQTKAQAKAQVLTPDIARTFTSLNKNTSLIAALKRINSKQELQQLVVAITRFVNNNINSKPNDIRTDLFSIANKFKKQVAEADNQQPDVEKAIQIIDRYTGLKSLLDNINSRKEYIEFITNLLKYVDPTLFTKRETDVKGALMGAANTITNAGTVDQRQKIK